MQNTGNTSSENPLEKEYAKKISKVLNLDTTDVLDQMKQKGVNQYTIDLLKQNPANDDLNLVVIKKDWSFIKDMTYISGAVAQAALQQSSKAMNSLPEEMKQDTKIARSIITAYIKDGKNFLDVEKYLEAYFLGSKEYEILIQHYLKTQKLHGVFARNDLTSLLIDIKGTQFYTHLKSQKSITGIGNYIKPSTSLIRSFLKNIENENIDAITDEGEKKGAFLKIFTLVINSNPDSLSEQERLVFDKILEICIGEYNKKFLPKNKKQKEKIDKDKPDYQDSFEKELDFEDYTPEEKLDYCYPSRSYSISDSGNYSVILESNKILEISKLEMQQASIKALENYAIFYETLCSAKLEFLWKKYKEPFSVACSNAFGFDYLRGEGVTTSKLLQVLNFVGRNIGIPEYEYTDNAGENQSEVRCFDDKKSAIDSFKYIQKSGKINDEVIDLNPDGSERRVVEQYLIQVGLLDGKGAFHTLSWQ